MIGRGEFHSMIVKLMQGLRAGGQGATPAGSAVGRVGRRPWVLHPFLIGIFPIVSLFAHNVYETPPRVVALPIALTLSSTFVAWLALRLLSGDASRAGLAASLLVASFFGFKGFDEACVAAWDYLSTFWIYEPRRPSPLISMALLAIADVVGIFSIFRWLGHPARWTRALNVFTAVLVAIPTVGAASAMIREPGKAHREVALPAVAKRGWTPDIYFIVLDGYARGDVMKELFGFDNGPFLERMERRGFFVARRSHSNYCQTRLSIASTLNANYLDTLVQPGTSDLLPLSEAIRDSVVRRSLRPLGYKFVSFATDFEPTDVFDADVYLKPRLSRAGFSQILLEMTPLAAWLSEVVFQDRFTTLRDRTLFLLDRLPEVAAIKEPTFTFAHLLAPHPPFVFGEHGEDVSPRRFMPDGTFLNNKAAFRTPEYFREAYRKESVYLTGRVERLIEQILATSPEPPVIILQSDHGSWLRYHLDDVEATDLRERFGILNCIYVPDRKVEGLTDEMTSVNTFRTILSCVAGADLPPLEDHSYFSTFQKPLVFLDVTRRLHSEGERTRTFRYPSTYLGVDPQF